MITKTKGNLLDFPNGIDAITHSCNCFGAYGAGIALSIRQRYPVAYEKYMQTYKAGLGSISKVQIEGNKRIYNSLAQYDYRGSLRHLNYEALYECLLTIEEDMLIDKLKTLGVPYLIGCNRAGGSWRVVEAILYDVFENSNINLTIVEFNGTINK